MADQDTVPKCFVCHVSITDEINEEELKVSSLEAQLNVIFVLKHIFELTSKQLEEYLHKLGNPRDWVKICKRCEDDIVNARVIYGRLHQISRDLDKAKYQLKNRTERPTKLNDHHHGNGSSDVYFFRDEFICRGGQLKEPPSENPFHDGDLKATQLAWEMQFVDISPIQVKLEDDAEDDDMSFDETETSAVECDLGKPERIRNSKSSKQGNDSDVLHFCRQGNSEGPDLSSSPAGSGMDVEPVEVEVKLEQETDFDGLFNFDLSDESIKGTHSHLAESNSSYVAEKENAMSLDSCCNDPTGEMVLGHGLEYYGDLCSDSDSCYNEDEDYDSENSSSSDAVDDESGKKRKALKKIRRKCPVCRKVEFTFKPFTSVQPFSAHLEVCSSSSTDKLKRLECVFCKKWQCLPTETKEYMEHLIRCKNGIPKDKETSVPWTHALIKCSICNSGYIPFPEFPNHVLSFHRREYGCTRCPRRFTWLDSTFRSHWDVQHKDLVNETPNSERFTKRNVETLTLPDIPWWCPAPRCHQEFPDEAARDAHILTCQRQSEVPERSLTCLWCDRKYYHEEELLMHRIIVHQTKSPPKTYKCEEKDCEATFKTQNALMSHQNKVHGQLFRCRKCGSKFETRTKLRVHNNQVHGTEERQKKTTCQVCGKCFSTKYKMLRHVAQVHEDNVRKNAVCEVCGKAFPDKYKVKRHLLQVHGKLKDCKKCGGNGCQKCLASKTKVRQNDRVAPVRGKRTLLKKQTDTATEKEWRKFTCAVCGKNFPDNYKLKRHFSQVHAKGSKEFKCGVKGCPKTFETLDLLLDHARSEHGAKQRKAK